MTQRYAFSLIELSIAMAASTLLLVGLASCLYISSQALPEETNASQQTRLAAVILHDLAADLNQAVAFTERTATAITFTVPDRTGDNTVETIRYAWSGTPGDPLTYQFNGGAVVNLATNVQSFNLSALTREMLADTMVTPSVGNVVFEEYTSAKLASNGTSITITKPPGTATGDLLIAAVSLDGNVTTSLTGSGGWNLLSIGPPGGTIRQTFGVWWKIATATEPAGYQFNWALSEQAYAWIMRFTGHEDSNPIIAFATESGTAALAVPSPAVVMTVENAMILRLVGLDGTAVTPGAPGLPLHTPITMDRSSTSSFTAASGGAGYVVQAAAGDSGTSTFTILSTEEYTSMTVAIAPEADP